MITQKLIEALEQEVKDQEGQPLSYQEVRWVDLMREAAERLKDFLGCAMIKAKDSSICRWCGAKGAHSICIAKPPYPVIPMSAIEELYAGNRPRVTETLRDTVTKIEAASRKVGRPKKRNALNAAERARAYRERKKNA